MPLVRLSGNVRGVDDPKRKERAEILYHLFANGWDIYNANGDQVIKLTNIQNKILKSDAFVFSPKPSLEDYFNFSSIFVGLQTNDDDLKSKPVILINTEQSWEHFIALIDNLIELGTIRAEYRNLFKVVDNAEQMVTALDITYKETLKKSHDEPDILEEDDSYIENTEGQRPEYSVCVFCSASIQDQEYLDEGYNVGKFLAENNIGCISGAGKTGIMGQVVKGAYENKGWSAGSNVPHIIKMEGLPDGLNEFWPRANIYTRMEIMIKRSNSFLIMPGGMGTVQELLALILLKEQKHDLMRDKKIVIYNKFDKSTGRNFWQPFIAILDELRHLSDFVTISENLDECFRMLK